MKIPKTTNPKGCYCPTCGERFVDGKEQHKRIPFLKDNVFGFYCTRPGCKERAGEKKPHEECLSCKKPFKENGEMFTETVTIVFTYEKGVKVNIRWCSRPGCKKKTCKRLGI